MTQDGLLARAGVRRVQEALAAAGSDAEVIALAETARSAADAASALGVPVGAIVKSLVFRSGDQAVLALVAGDRNADTDAIARALGLAQSVVRADADFVKAKTGQSIGGVAPVGHAERILTVIDESLGRFDKIWAAGGHPHCVFATTPNELSRVTKVTAGAISTAINVRTTSDRLNPP
ncbi:YbaK/EbsC family protein [Desertibaculum subflavum]|uniref:YbaK/EbsC family protein n=1 Tax=Desertibaculum subflavum TaxID=2268458 RepID=UPI000E66FF1A